MSAIDEEEARAERFAAVVKSRRNELGLTRDDVAAAGGPSYSTMTTIENGRQFAQPLPATFRKLEAALGWAEGSAVAAWLKGEPPTLRRDSRPGHPVVDEDTVSLTITFIEELGSLAKDYEALAQDLDSPALRDVNHRLDAIVDRLMRKWVIKQVELRSTAPGVSTDKSYEVLVGEYLDRHLPEAGVLPDEDVDDLSYLRWLTGRNLPEHVDTSAFKLRWAQRER